MSLDQVKAHLSAANANISAAATTAKEGVLNAGSAAKSVVVQTANSVVEKTTPKPAASVADTILAAATSKAGIAKPSEDASILRKAIVTPFHYADVATSAVGTGITHATKAVRNTIDFVLSSVATAISMAFKAVAFVLTGISLPVIGAVGASVAVATSPFTAPALAVKISKDREIAVLKDEKAALEKELASSKEGSPAAPVAQGPSLLERAKAAGNTALEAGKKAVNSTPGKVVLGLAALTVLSLGAAAAIDRIDGALHSSPVDFSEVEEFEVNTVNPIDDEKAAPEALAVLANILPRGSLYRTLLGSPRDAFNAASNLFKSIPKAPTPTEGQEEDLFQAANGYGLQAKSTENVFSVLGEAIVAGKKEANLRNSPFGVSNPNAPVVSTQ